MKKYIFCYSVFAMLFIGSQMSYAGAGANLLTVAQSAINKNFDYLMSQEQMLADLSQDKEALALWFPQVGIEATSITGNYDTNLSDHDFDIPNANGNFDTKSNYWMVGVRQDIFNLTNVEKVDAASVMKKINILQYAIAQQKLLQKTISAYFNYLMTQELTKIAAANLSATTAELKNAYNLKSTGFVVKADVQEADADKQNALLKLLQAKNNEKIALENLNNLANSNYKQIAPLNPGFIAYLPKVPGQSYWEQQSLRGNPSLEVIELRIQAYHYKELAAMFEHMPTVEGYASYVEGDSKNAGIASMTLSPSSSVNISGAVGNNVSYSYHGDMVGVEVHMPLFAGGYYVDKQRQAAHLMEKSQFQLDDGRQQIRLAVDQAYQRLQEDKQSIALAQAELAASHSGLVNMERQINVGFNSPLDISQARSKYITAQENLLIAKYQYINELINLRYLAGDLNQKTVMQINQWLVG